MPMPWTYRHASQEFGAFIADLREETALESDNMAYTALDGVFRTFRRRLSPQEAVAFAQELPAVLRAIFVQDWDLDAPLLPFGSRDDMTREAQALRPDHNLAPDNVIEAVAVALWRRVDHRRFEALLQRLPDGAVAFWAVTGDPARIAPRFF